MILAAEMIWVPGVGEEKGRAGGKEIETWRGLR